MKIVMKMRVLVWLDVCYPQPWIMIIGSVLGFFTQSYKVEIRNVS